MLRTLPQTRLSQRLTMTPQMQLAIRLLTEPIMELQARINEALNENVFLEIHESAEWTVTERMGLPNMSSNGVELTTDDATLSDYLLWQLQLENLGASNTVIGHAIIDSIDENGYLTADFETIRDTVAPEVMASVDGIETVLRLVQQLEPAGVGARSLEECLLLQLTQLDPGIPGLELACSIVKKEKLVELFVSQEFNRLKQEFGASDEDLHNAIALVRNCDPYPCGSINAPTAETVIPDVFVRQIGNNLIVEINHSPLPQLKINETYANALGNEGGYAEYRAQLNQARWLIQSLKKRNETLHEVALTIVEQQKEFFERGEEYMRPMVHRDVAQVIEKHESTVSRVTANKYMHTPRGTFEFRYFFSSHLNSDSGRKSSKAVRAKIRQFVNDENLRKPLSDNQIKHLLSDAGIRVARRTIAKYREKMGIPSSTKRKGN